MIKLLNEEVTILQQKKHFKSLDNKLNRPVPEKLLTLDKRHLFYMVFTLTKLKYFMSQVHDKFALLMRRHSEPRTRNHMRRFDPDTYKTLIKSWASDDPDETEIRRPCYRSFYILECISWLLHIDFCHG